LQQGILAKQRQVITADILPRVDLTGSAGYQAGSTGFLFKEPYDTWRVSLVLKIPVFDGLRVSGRRAQNNAQLTQVKQAILDAERKLEVARSTTEREQAQARAYRDMATEAHAAAEEALRTSREAFDLGLISSLDLLQAERAERQAESQRRKSELSVWQARFNHRRAIGLAPEAP
jgi:outer membrane protein TolC